MGPRWYSAPWFRPARPASARWNVTKTLLQTCAFWATFLGVLPYLLLQLEARAGLSRIAAFAHPAAAAAVFTVFSALGLWSGLTMAMVGRGTPLPLDGPRELVVRGPYAFVRNPMAVAGLGQGFAVGLTTGSLTIVTYVIVGGLLWHVAVRPAEEAHLRREFGEPYARYRAEVRCWIPRLWPYRGSAGESVS